LLEGNIAAGIEGLADAPIYPPPPRNAVATGTNSRRDWPGICMGNLRATPNK